MERIFSKTFAYVALLTALFAFSSGCTVLGIRIGDKKPASTPSNIERDKAAGVFKSVDKGKSFVFKGRINDKETVDNLNITRLQFDLQDSLTLYILSKNKGLWVSYNGGESVQNLVEEPIDTFALDPKIRGTLYLGKGAQITKTKDGGMTWTSVFMETDENAIASIAVSPDDSSRIFAVTGNGSFFGSDDGGNSWRLIKKIRIKTVRELVINPKNSKEMYIATEFDGVFKSGDAGANWNIVQGLQQFKGSERTHQFKLNPLEPSHLFLASDAGFLISVDNGGNWRALPLLSGTGGSAALAIGFNPFSEREVYYATRDSFFKSIDGGESWSVMPLYVSGTPAEILVDDVDENIIYIGVGQN